MPNAELLTNNNIAGALQQSLNELGAVYSLKRYNRVINGGDGYLYWVLAGEDTVQGNLHFEAKKDQTSLETVTRGMVQFNTLSKQEEFFNDSMLVVLETVEEGQTLRYAFNELDAYHTQTKEYHYSGSLVETTIQNFFVDSANNLPNLLNNSFPLWLEAFNQNSFIAFASYATPVDFDNPYISVSIANSVDASSVQNNGTDFWVLKRDTVNLDLLKFTDNDAMSLLYRLHSIDQLSEKLGIVNYPVIEQIDNNKSTFNLKQNVKRITVEVSYINSTSSSVPIFNIETVNPTFSLS